MFIMPLTSTRASRTPRKSSHLSAGKIGMFCMQPEGTHGADKTNHFIKTGTCAAREKCGVVWDPKSLSFARPP